MGWNASDTRPLTFERLPRARGEPAGPRGSGFKQFLHILDIGRIGVAAMGVGLAQGALDEALKYAKERKAFGKPISKFQAIQAKLADMSTEIEAARLLVYKAALEKDAGENFTLTAAQAKLKTGRLAVRCAEEAVQIHGGYGYIEEYPVCRFYRDAKILTIGEGTDEVQQMVIARALGHENSKMSAAAQGDRYTAPAAPCAGVKGTARSRSLTATGPVLGALPTRPLPSWLWLAVLVPVAVGALVGWRSLRAVSRLSTWQIKAETSAAACALCAVALTVAVWLSGGSAGAARLAQRGRQPVGGRCRAARRAAAGCRGGRRRLAPARAARLTRAGRRRAGAATGGGERGRRRAEASGRRGRRLSVRGPGHPAGCRSCRPAGSGTRPGHGGVGPGRQSW